MRILVTGASGMLGSALAAKLSNTHEVFGTGLSQIDVPFNYKGFDLSNDSYVELIEWSKPELIIHCAALTHGNYCENHVLEAFNINGYSVQKLLDSTEDNVKIIYISTDAVFPSRLHMAKEADCSSPESIYGKSKEIGEFFLLNSERKSLIVRTTIVGLNPFTDKTGFVEWIIKTSKQKTNISLFDDVLFNPISVWNLIAELSFLIKQEEFKSKILHISGAENTTKYNFGIELLKSLSLDIDSVEKGYISDFKDRAKRSNDQTLSTEFYQTQFQRHLPKLKDTIESIKENYNEIH